MRLTARLNTGIGAKMPRSASYSHLAVTRGEARMVNMRNAHNT
jgi:hypothetical protein